jgi:hypothetical protein
VILPKQLEKMLLKAVAGGTVQCITELVERMHRMKEPAIVAAVLAY